MLILLCIAGGTIHHAHGTIIFHEVSIIGPSCSRPHDVVNRRGRIGGGSCSSKTNAVEKGRQKR